MSAAGRIAALRQAIENAKANIGRRAATAVGDDIPRPRPPALDPITAGMTLDLPGGAPPDPARIAALVRKLETQGPESLDILEGLELVRAGAEPDLVFAGRLGAQQSAALLRKVQQGGIESLTPEELAALRRTPGAEPYVADAPAAPSVAPVSEPQAARPFFQQGQSLVGEDGSQVRRLDDERFIYEDGTVVDVEGNVIGSMATGDLTDTSMPMGDNLAASATEIGDGVSGLSPNRARVAPLDKLASDFWQVTADTDLESLSPDTLKSVANRVARYTAVGPDGVVSYDPEFLKAINYDRGGRERLERLSQLTGGGGSPSPARGIDAPASTPRQRASTQEDLQAAKQLVGETLPEGDWNALMTAFNAMPPERKAEVLERLSSGRSLRAADTSARGVDSQVFKEPRPGHERRLSGQPLDPATAERGESLKLQGSQNTRTGAQWDAEDAYAARPLIGKLLDRSTGDPAFTPNAQAEIGRGVNPFHEGLIQLDAAIRSGDEAAIADAKLNLQTMPADEAEVQEAQRAYMARQQAASELRRAMLATDPEYLDAQRAALEAAVSAPPPRNVLPQGTRSPETALEPVPPQEMPTQFDNALAEQRAREDRLAEQASLEGALTKEQRDAIADANEIPKNKRPLLLRGEDRQNTPFYKSSRGDRASSLSKTDKQALGQAEELRAARESAESDLTRAMYELRLAQIARTSGRSAATAEDIANAQAEVARLQGVVKQLYDREDALFPPRVINSSTGLPVVDTKTGALVDVRPAWLKDESLVPKGYHIERGYRGTPDSVLNKASTQHTYDDLNVAVTGFRPRLPGGLERSSPDMSAAERQLQAEELRRGVLGDRGAEEWSDAVYPEGTPGAEDVPQSGRGKKGRLGGSRQVSRVQGALQQVYGTIDPFSLKGPDNRPVFTRDRAGVLALARDYLARNTDISPGTPSEALSLEDWATAIEREYGIGRETADDAARTMQSGGRFVEDEGAVRLVPSEQQAVSSRPADVSDAPAADAGVSDGLDASAVDLGDVSGDDVPAAAGKKGGKRGGKKAAKDDVAPVTGGDVDEAAVRQAISDEADRVYEETKRNYTDMGASDRTAVEYADDAREQYVRSQSAARLKGATGGDVPVTPAAETPAPQATKRGGKKGGRGKKDTAPAADDTKPVTGDDVPASPVDGDEAKAADAAKAADDAADGSTPKTPDTEGTPEIGPPPPKKKGWGRWPYVAGAVGGTAVLAGLARMGGGGGYGPIDIPLPPGGGGGGGGGPGGGDFYPIPPGGSAGAMDEAAAQEAALQRALERIRGARSNPSGLSEPYQTLQNYSIWR